MPCWLTPSGSQCQCHYLLKLWLSTKMWAKWRLLPWLPLGIYFLLTYLLIQPGYSDSLPNKGEGSFSHCHSFRGVAQQNWLSPKCCSFPVGDIFKFTHILFSKKYPLQLGGGIWMVPWINSPHSTMTQGLLFTSDSSLQLLFFKNLALIRDPLVYLMLSFNPKRKNKREKTQSWINLEMRWY